MTPERAFGIVIIACVAVLAVVGTFWLLGHLHGVG